MKDVAVFNAKHRKVRGVSYCFGGQWKSSES